MRQRGRTGRVAPSSAYGVLTGSASGVPRPLDNTHLFVFARASRETRRCLHRSLAGDELPNPGHLDQISPALSLVQTAPARFPTLANKDLAIPAARSHASPLTVARASRFVAQPVTSNP